jgi:Na+/H+ antiporter NhaD/arsenite permease-like protein
VRRFLKAHFFLAGAGGLAVLAVAAGRVPLREVARVQDGRLLLTLFALILSVELLRDSGLLDSAMKSAVGRFSHARSLTLSLVLASGGLSALVTNDVALFVVIPFTVASARYSNFRVRNAVILEVLAANLLGCVTPIGNPQNLFISHLSGMSVARFLAVMSPFFAASLLLLGAAVFVLEPARSIERIHAEPPALKPAAAFLGLAGIALVLLAIGRVLAPAIPCAVAALAAAILLGRRVLRESLLILPLFLFVFIDMAAVHSFDFAGFFGRLPLPPDLRLFLAGTLLSQILSNVPTAVLLAPVAAGRWKLLLYAVDAGGCGTLVASLANLLGWQIYSAESGRDPVFLRRFLRVNLLFLALVGSAAYLLA